MNFSDKSIIYDGMSERMKISRVTVKRAIARLRKGGAVKRSGGRKGGVWIVNQSFHPKKESGE
jgi:DNA-binding IscR family transcriptional regulator